MSNLWPVYVCTKGRPDSKLLRRLQDEGIKACCLVEDEEAQAYAAAFPGHLIWILPESNQGLMYSRKWALTIARNEHGHGSSDWFWMLDDDISDFFRFEGTRANRVTAAEALLAAQAEALPGTGQVALEYQQFAWSTKGAVKVNSYADVCVGIKVTVPAEFPVGMPFKGDRDFTLQVIAAGYDVRRVTKYAFAAPSNGSNKGGLYDLYQAKKDVEASAALAAKWPWCVEVQTKPSGRVDAKIHWRKVRQKHALT